MKICGKKRYKSINGHNDKNMKHNYNNKCKVSCNTVNSLYQQRLLKIDSRHTVIT